MDYMMIIQEISGYYVGGLGRKDADKLNSSVHKFSSKATVYEAIREEYFRVANSEDRLFDEDGKLIVEGKQ